MRPCCTARPVVGEPSRTSCASVSRSMPGRRPRAQDVGLVVVAQVDRAGVVAEQTAGLGQDFGQDLVEVVVGVDDLEQVAQRRGHLLAALDLAQALLGLGPQAGVFDGQRGLLGEGQAQVDLVGAVRVRRRGSTAPASRTPRRAPPAAPRRWSDRWRRGAGCARGARAGPRVRQSRAGPHHLEVGATIVELLVDGLRRAAGRARARNRRRPRCAASKPPGR